MNPAPMPTERDPGGAQPREDAAGNAASPGRRRALTLGVGVAAGAAGAWWAHSRLSPAVSAAPSEGFWDLAFEQPDGAVLTMARFRGRWLLINFWATWCPPCVEEMPLLDRFFAQQGPNGFQVLGLAIDQPSAVRQFLARTPVRFPIGLAGLAGTDLGRALGNRSGGLPFTVVMDPGGNVVQRKMGKVSEADLSAWSAPG